MTQQAAWALALLIYGAAAWWLFAHRAAISSDDALFFSRALTRFSVLDFSPQFPGYPGFVALGRLALMVTGAPVAALGLTTTMIALLLPPAAAVVAGRVAGPWAAWWAFLLVLAEPLTPDLALSLLSDGSAILFLLVFLALLPTKGQGAGRGRGVVAGLALGFAAACRPSDFALFVGALGGLAVTAPRLILPVISGMAVVGALALGVIFAHEGMLYVDEGLRFLGGHSTDWGNTLLSRPAGQPGWFHALLVEPGLGVVLFLFFLITLVNFWHYRRFPAVFSAFGALIVHGLFIVILQNPDHLRHLTPVVVLAALLAALAPWPLALAALIPAVTTLGLTTDPRPARPPPLATVAALLRMAPKGSAVAAREGVFALRALVPGVAVYDRHYPADADLGLKLATGEAFSLTTTPPSLGLAAHFRGRFLGEEDLWLLPRAGHRMSAPCGRGQAAGGGA